MILYAIHHTVYRYAIPTAESANEVRLMPLDTPHQSCLGFDLELTPAAKVYSYDEPGGAVHHFTIREPHCSLEITARAAVETRLKDPFANLNLLHDDWAEFPAVADHLVEFLVATRYVPHAEAVRRFASAVPREGSVATWCLKQMELVHDSLDYDPDATHVHTTLTEVLDQRAGVCQDFAHLLLGCLRMQGVPARYVSGYLYVGEQRNLRGSLATHAWVEALMPDGRWLGLDPTNRQLANDHYVVIHHGVDYSEVTPTRGIYLGGRTEDLDVKVTVTRDRTVEEVSALAQSVR